MSRVKVLELLVVDIESANIDSEKNVWSKDNSLICDIGVSQLDLDSETVKPVFSQTCREDITPDPKSWVFKNKKITHKQIVQSKHFSEIKEELEQLFESKLVTSWSHNFELAYLQREPRTLKIPNLFWEPKITLTKFLNFSSFFNCASKLPTVDETCQLFNLNTKPKKLQRAIDDALLESELIMKIIKKWPLLKNEWEQFL